MATDIFSDMCTAALSDSEENENPTWGDVSQDSRQARWMNFWNMLAAQLGKSSQWGIDFSCCAQTENYKSEVKSIVKI